jgi:hypothetical protein
MPMETESTAPWPGIDAASAAGLPAGWPRRALLAGLAAGAAWPGFAAAAALPPPHWSAWAARQPGGGAGSQRAGLLGHAGVALAERAHQVVAHGRRAGQAFVVSRRPGTWLWRIDGLRERILASEVLDDSRRFEGHAWHWLGHDAPHDALLTTETDTDSGQGLLAWRSAASLALQAEWPTHGIGPHQVLHWPAAGQAPGGLAVANGGILTLPETGRAKLNLDTMRSTLALLHPGTGELLVQWDAPHQRLSLRHLAVAADGTLGVAMQFEADGPAPVLALARRGEARLREVQAGAALLQRLQAYAGAIAAHGNVLAVTCPRGDRVVLWHSDGRLHAELVVPGACGVIAQPRGFWLSNALGDLYELDLAALQVRRVWQAPRQAFDNHLW